MLKELNKMESISKYYSLWEMLEENTMKEWFEENHIDEDDKLFLQHCDDFEGFAYYVINYDYVVVTESDSVIDRVSLQDFLDETIDRLKEDREERE